MANKETSVGGIVGFLRLDADQFQRAIDEAIAKTELLDGKKIDVHVDVDAGEALTELEFVAAAEEAVGDEAEDTEKRSNRAHRGAAAGVRPLLLAVMALGPAIVPLGAAAVGVGAAFGGMGAAGVLAVVGIKQEMDKGTAAGQQFSAGVDLMKSDLMGLASVAARGVLGPFNQTVSDLHEQIPGLSDEVGILSTITGHAASSILTGLVEAFHTLSPLMTGASVMVADLAGDFESFASSNGLKSFGDYVLSVMPQVGDTLESLVSAISAIVQAAAPIGLAVLAGLQSVSDVISALPTGVLTGLAVAIGAVVIALKGMKIASDVAERVTKLRATVDASKFSMAGLAGIAGVVSLALGGLAFLYIRHQENVRKDADEVRSLTEELIRNNGALEQSTIKQRQLDLIQQGGYDTAKKYGITAQEINDVLSGQSGAIDVVNKKLQENATHWNPITRAQLEAGKRTKSYNSDAKELADTLGTTASQTDRAREAQDEYNKVTDKTNGKVQQEVVLSAQQRAAKDLVADATRRQKAATDALVTAMDQEITKAAILAGGTLALDRAMLNMTQTLKKNNGAMSRHTQAGLDDRQAILTVVTSLQQQRDNLIRTGTASDVATRKYSSQATQLLQNIARTQGANSEAYKYAQQLLKIPKNVSTYVHAYTDGAVSNIRAVQRAIDALHDRNVTITTTHVNAFNRISAMTGALPSQQAEGGFYPHGVRAMADGGSTRQAMMMRQTSPILWNEAPGGESYIPLAPSKRARATRVLAETNEYFGDPLGAGAGRHKGGSQMLRLHPADIRELAKEVARRPVVLDGQRISSSVGRSVMGMVHG